MVADAAALEVNGLTVALGDRPAVVDHVSIHVAAGESLVLLGPSGCGKTTFLRSLAGLERPVAGSIRVGSDVVVDSTTYVPAERRRIGLVFQDWALFPHLSVEGNVGFGLPRSQRRGPVVDDLLGLVGLAGMGRRMPSTLSGGQQQRVALARALAPQPRVLLLDEPFSNLDSSLRAEVRSEVAALLTAIGTTSILVTHDQEEAFVLGDRIAVMRDGSLTQIATPDEVYAAPADPWTARFVGDGTMIRAIARDGTADSVVGPVPLQDREVCGPVDLWIRPEQLVVRAVDGRGEATIESVEFRGPDTMMVVDVDGVRVVVRAVGPPRLNLGDRVRVEHQGDPVRAFAVADDSAARAVSGSSGAPRR